MMLINMLDIAQQLEAIDQEAHYNIDTDTFHLMQGHTDKDDECYMDSLSFKDLAMYATGLAAQPPAATELV